MSIIVPANSAVAGGFDVENSCRFDGSTSKMSVTPGSNGDLTKFTFSGWIKRGSLGVRQSIITSLNAVGSHTTIEIDSSDRLNFYDIQGSSYKGQLLTTRVLRDTSAWYHIVCVWDTDNSTAADRMIVYINGVKETIFTTNTEPTSGQVGNLLEASVPTGMGVYWNGTSGFWNGYMSEIALLDGTAAAVTDFGEFDEDSGIWKPIDVSGLTFGSQGFYLNFQDSANLGNDANGGTDLTETGLTAIDQSTDSCTNNFATGNILSPYANRTITDGSLTITSTTTQWTNICSTIGVSSGKWWIELKHTAGSYGGLGIVSPFPQTENNVIGDFSAPVIQQIGYVAASGDKKINNSTSSYGSTWVGTGDIVNMSLNLDDNELKFYKNGTVQDSGTAIAISSGYTYFVGTSNYNSSGSSFNFGNPAFSISSGNADANGYGNFEYAPPAGFLALCTKNLSGELS